jgi:hypothetical protein
MIERLDTVFVHQGSQSFEPVMAHRFKATITRCPPGIGFIPNDLWFTVRRVNPGGRAVDSETYMYLNKVIQYPSKKGVCMSATLSLGLFAGKKSQAYRFMKRWYKLVYDESGAGVSAVGVLTQNGQDVDGASAVNGDIRITLHNPDTTEAYSITLKDCWPQTVRLIDLDMESGDQMAMMEYTFVVNDWDSADDVT